MERSWKQVQDAVRRKVAEQTSSGQPVTSGDIKRFYIEAGGNPKSAGAFSQQIRSGGFSRSTGIELDSRRIGNRTVYFDSNNRPSEKIIRKSLFG